MYWGNPQVYITSAADAAPFNAHFILHNFKTSDMQPLSGNVRNVNVMGELWYKVSLHSCIGSRTNCMVDNISEQEDANCIWTNQKNICR